MDDRTERSVMENLEYHKETGELYWKNNMGRNLVAGKQAGSKNKRGYTYVTIGRKHLLLHRIAWFLYYGTWPEKCIDHINGNTEDNRIENLRDVSLRTNQGNQKKHRSGRLVGTTFLKDCPKNPSCKVAGYVVICL